LFHTLAEGIWSTALYGAENWTLPRTEQKYLNTFEKLCWIIIEKINWTDHVTNKEVLATALPIRNTVQLYNQVTLPAITYFHMDGHRNLQVLQSTRLRTATHTHWCFS
jgi:hypothetical protein